MFKIYHNPQCKKSRAGLQFLQSAGVPFEIVEYIKIPLSEVQIEKLLAKLNIRPEELIRKQEEYYKKSLKGKKFHDHEWIKILAQNPRLIQRPVVELGNKAVIGDPVENIEILIHKNQKK
jgi:arsenate reductase (glutaredoxin)